MTNPETIIQREIKHHLNVTGRCRLLRNNCGLDKAKGILFGLGTGSADLVGVLKGGQCLAIEVKTPKGPIRPEQLAWWRSAYQWGVRGGVARSLAGAFRLLEEAERGPMVGDLRDYD